MITPTAILFLLSILLQIYLLIAQDIGISGNTEAYD